MGYAIMRTGKLKSQGSMTDRYMHDERIYRVNNADPALSSQNVDLVDQLNGRTYYDVYEDTVNHLQMTGAIKTKIRKDAVKGLDIFLGFSKEDADGMDVREWARRNVEWLEREFNPPDRMIHYTDREGKEVTEEVNNVKSVILHMDEATPHIHAFIVPIDEKGHLNARAYCNGHEKLTAMQDHYSEAMEPFGLSRGEQHSSARHEKVSEYYNKLLQAVEATLSPPMPGESVQEYYRRAEEEYRIQQVHHRDEIVQMNREVKREHSDNVEERMELDKERAEFKDERADFEREVRRIAKSIGEDELTPDVLRRIRSDLAEKRCFWESVKSYPDRLKAKETSAAYKEMVNWQRKKARARGSEKNEPSN